MALELTDRGWATCAPLSAPTCPPNRRARARRSTPCCERCGATFDRDGLAPGDVFFRSTTRRLPASPTCWATGRGQGPRRLRRARGSGRRLGGPGAPTGRTIDVSRHDLDAALPHVSHSRDQPRPRGESEDLTAEDHAAAISIGDQAKHRSRSRTDGSTGKGGLSSLRLSWALTADDLWLSQGTLHVPGFNDRPSTR
jgi:hypothetical protein